MFRQTGSPKMGEELSTRRQPSTTEDNQVVVIEMKPRLNEDLSHINTAFDMTLEPECNSPIINGKLQPIEDLERSKPVSLLDRIRKWMERRRHTFKTPLRVALIMLYNLYLGVAIHQTWFQSDSWCEGVRFLLLITGAIYVFIFYKFVIKPYVLQPSVVKALSQVTHKISSVKYGGKIIWTAIWISIVTFLIVDSEDDRYRLVSAAGLLVLIALGFVFSTHPSKVVWHQVQVGVLMQFLFGFLILRWDIGRAVFVCIGDKVKTFLQFADHGSTFLFGFLVTGELKDLPVQPAIFAFKVLSVIVYFSFIVSILYYYGWMQSIVINLGWCLQKIIGTTACESINAAANIFLGMSEAPMVIQPYIPHMTKSELHAVMTGGFATIAGSVLAAYISFGVNASHLLTASVMSAPAALAYSKLIYPETEMSVTSAEDIKMEKPTERSALEAGAKGASTAIQLVSNIAVNLIAVIAVIALTDFLFSWFGSLVNCGFFSFEWLLSKLFIPLSLIMGVDWDDKEKVAKLVGLKTVVNEFVAYTKLAELQKENSLTPRSEAIATFALCGFSNISSIGIQLASLGTMAPDRKSDLGQLALRAMIAGSTACFMTACVAGTLLKHSS